jgi:hypothetical protein
MERMTYDLSTITDLVLVALIIGGGLGYLWGRRFERNNWNRLIDMKIFPLPPKWVKRSYPGTGDSTPNPWFPESPPDNTPVWDEVSKKYIHLDPAELRRRRQFF